MKAEAVKAHTEWLRELVTYENSSMGVVAVHRKSIDALEAQAREIERLRDGLEQLGSSLRQGNGSLAAQVIIKQTLAASEGAETEAKDED